MHAAYPLVKGRCPVKSPADGLEDRFNDVVLIFAVIHIDVQVHAAAIGKGLKEFFG